LRSLVARVVVDDDSGDGEEGGVDGDVSAVSLFEKSSEKLCFLFHRFALVGRLDEEKSRKRLRAATLRQGKVDGSNE